LNDEQIGRRVGKDRSTIKNLRNLLALPPEILNNIGEGDGKIPQGTARKLVKVARLAPKEVSATVKRILKNPDDIEQIVNQTINQHAITIDHTWDPKWLSTPIGATDKDGAFEIGACDGWLAFVNIGKTPYCTNRRCFDTKSQLFVTSELERVSKKHGIPIAQPGEKATVLDLSYDTTARVSAATTVGVVSMRLTTRKKRWGYEFGDQIAAHQSLSATWQLSWLVYSDERSAGTSTIWAAVAVRLHPSPASCCHQAIAAKQATRDDVRDVGVE
jgi:hypothetical protein